MEVRANRDGGALRALHHPRRGEMKHSSTAMTMTKATVFLLAMMSFFPALTLAADAKIIQAAKSEGSSTLWTSSDLRTATALVQRFEKQYPFKGKRLPNGNWRTAQQDHD